MGKSRNSETVKKCWDSRTVGQWSSENDSETVGRSWDSGTMGKSWDSGTVKKCWDSRTVEQ